MRERSQKPAKKLAGLKGFVVGVVATLTLSATIVAANPVMREVLFGINVSFNGQIQQFEDDMRPFTMDGRTFLPVGAIANIVGLDVDFDPATNTVLLTTAHGQGATPDIPTAAGNRLADTAFHGTGLNTNANNHTATTGSVNMVGATHTNVTTYQTIHGNHNIETHHNLGGSYTRLTGLFGRVDGHAGTRSATVTFIGDGTPIHSVVLESGQMPVSIDVDVTGVQLLVVRVTSHANNAPNAGAGNTRWALSADIR
ncbi:MAG: NPCBM/NEW2 domain-containing protein [Defluviitaleaceae bacterium]|nr:NPCBM/NEW2 domain-containing protein [Defluviitaleaceae bacterium]